MWLKNPFIESPKTEIYFMNLTVPQGGKKSVISTGCGLLDVTNLVAAPPPEFSISFSPSALELRPSSLLDNDEKRSRPQSEFMFPYLGYYL